MTAVLGLIAGLLQLSVPSYGFRLVRRYGIHRVGWFLVTAFSLLAFLHLLLPVNASLAESDLLMNILYGGAAVLLLIGMGHMETLFVQREKVQQEVQKQWESQVQTESAQLSKSNRELLQQLTFREHNEAALRRSEAEHRLLFAENPQPMWIVDLQTRRFLAVNRAVAGLYGLTPEEFGGIAIDDLQADPTDARFGEEMLTACPEAQTRGLWQHRRKDGSLVEVELAAIDLTFGGQGARLMVVTDTTGRHRREHEIVKSERHGTVTRFSEGIARNFHQLFALIERNTAAILGRQPEAETAAAVTEISAASRRGAGITRQLLAISGQCVMKPELFDLNVFVRNLHSKLGRLLGERIEFQISQGCYQAFVNADPRLLEHVLVNLAINARDAIPAGGAVLVQTEIFRNAEDHSRPGEFVRLSLRDTGPGMTPETRARLFEPFFSTKDPAKALGLGLATVHSIVRQHSGWVECIAEPGTGTDFSVFLPCVAAPDEGQTEILERVPERKGTVLLVETDDRTRGLARCALNWNGYRVIEADSPSVALVLWGEQRRDIRLLLTGMSFSDGGTGPELVSRLQQDRPDLKVIYTTDGTGLDTMPQVNFLLKPYSPEHLLREVTNALQQR